MWWSLHVAVFDMSGTEGSPRSSTTQGTQPHYIEGLDRHYMIRHYKAHPQFREIWEDLYRKQPNGVIGRGFFNHMLGYHMICNSQHHKLSARTVLDLDFWNSPRYSRPWGPWIAWRPQYWRAWEPNIIEDMFTECLKSEKLSFYVVEHIKTWLSRTRASNDSIPMDTKQMKFQKSICIIRCVLIGLKNGSKGTGTKSL